MVAITVGWWFIPAFHEPAWRPAALSGGNLLLVTIDTLRADRVTTSLAPNFTRLAARGHVFRTAYTHAPLTLPSHASILTGLLPPAHGVRGNGTYRLDASHLTLAERLRQRGYRTGAFVGAFVLDSRFGLGQGFDRYAGVDDDRSFAADFGFAQRRAPDVLNPAADWIQGPAAADQPWFAWVHVFDPHAPYDAPGAPAQEGYDGEVRFVDRAVGEFLERLDKGGALARTVVMLTADHGESLGEHGESTHGLFTYDATMRVPLVIAGPQLGAGIHDAPASLIDLVPTALDVLGLPADPALPGRSLRPGAGEARPVYLEAMDGWLTAGAAPVAAVVQDNWKLIETPLPELYDLASDPRETNNLIAASADRVRRLRTILPALAAGSAAAAPLGLDPTAQARLRSLGYASGVARAPGAGFAERDDPKRVLPLYERFLALLADGARDLAGLRAIVEARPAFEAARLAAASILIETGRAGEAVSLLEGSAMAADASIAMRERLGAAYLAAGRPDRAVAILEQVAAGGAASADAWNALGVSRAQLGRHTDARAAFDTALGLAPDAARIAFNRALARLESGDRAGATQDVKGLTGQHPAFADGWKVMATLQHESGDRASAVVSWQRVLEVDPGNVDVLFNLAVTLRDLGHLDEARAAARQFAAIAPRPAYDRELAIVAALLNSR